MPPSTPPRNAGEALTWTATQETEATHLSAGYRDALTFDLVPRTSLRFATPDPGAAQRLRSPGSLRIEVPIQGEAVNFEPGVTLDCDLSWLVRHGTAAPRAFPVGGAKMVVAPNGTFHIQVNGRTPTVDVVEHRLINEGLLGYAVTPHFPHAEQSEFAPALRFNNPCSLTANKPQGVNLRVGELVTFSPHFSSVLNKAELELRVIELDEGSSEVASGAGRYAFTHRWEPSGLWMFSATAPVPWAIGFTDSTCERFADVGDEEEGAYEYGWQLWGRSRAEGPQTLLLEEKDFLKLPKPRLEELKVEWAPSWHGTWEVHGQVTGVAPRAGLMLEVAIIEPAAPAPMVGPMEPHRTPSVRVQLGADGIFEANLGERHWSSPPRTSASPPPPRGYAIVSLVAAMREGRAGPIAPYLDFDESTFSAFKDETLSWDCDSPWVCSMEATSLVTRPPKPKRRKSGLTPSPAPGPEVGDQKTPITFEELWQDIIAWEGVVPYMYLDKPGNVTVGAGNLLQRLEPRSPGDKLAAKSHPFQNLDAGRAATPEEIADAFNRVQALARGMPAVEYALRPKIGLTDAYIKQVARERYEGEFLPALKRAYPQFETYPRAARRALIDLIYNVGIGMPREFPTLSVAVKARDWTTAAKEGRTRAQNREDTRNHWRKDCFLYAARVDKTPPGT